jgi:hypothetical protein
MNYSLTYHCNYRTHKEFSIITRRCLVPASNGVRSLSSGVSDLSTASAISLSLLTTAALKWFSQRMNDMDRTEKITFNIASRKPQVAYNPLVTEERYWALFYMPLVTEERYWALFYMPLYRLSHNLLNVLLHIANKMRLQTDYCHIL